MTTIKIAHEVPAATVAKIAEYLDEVARRDINWNGARFKLSRGDFTCIPNDDRMQAIQVLNGINDIIDGVDLNVSCEEDANDE